MKCVNREKKWFSFSHDALLFAKIIHHSNWKWVCQNIRYRDSTPSISMVRWGPFLLWSHKNEWEQTSWTINCARSGKPYVYNFAQKFWFWMISWVSGNCTRNGCSLKLNHMTISKEFLALFNCNHTSFSSFLNRGQNMNSPQFARDQAKIGIGDFSRRIHAKEGHGKYIR